jgi:hypothetical protein
MEKASAPSVGPDSTCTGLDAVARVVLPIAIAEETQRSLRAAGLVGNEGLVVWSGVQDGSMFHILTATVPRQRGIRTAEGVCVVVDGDALHQLNVDTFKRGERLFAQVHSHPGRAYHSAMDDQYAVITSPGGLSLVVPDFAVRPFRVAECAVYQLARGGRWREIDKSRAGAFISITNDHIP